MRRQVRLSQRGVVYMCLCIAVFHNESVINVFEFVIECRTHNHSYAVLTVCQFLRTH